MRNNNFNSISERLISNKSVSDYQIQELLKAERSLVSLQNSLKQQNNSLENLIKEELDINAEIKKRTTLKKKNDLRVDEEGDSTNKKQKTSKLPVTINLQIESDISFEKLDFKDLKIPNLKNRTILCLCIKNDDIYIGGSDGLLVRYDKSGTHGYDTDKNHSIRQIFLKKHNKIPYLYALSNTMILIYSNTNILQSYIDVPELTDAFYHGYTLFIILADGTMRYLNNGSLELKKYKPNLFKNVQYFIPSSNSNSHALIYCQDSVLHKVPIKNLNNRHVISGITNVKGMFRRKECEYICYSEDKLWILNKDCEQISTLTCSYRIKILKFNGDQNCFFLLDYDNCLHILSYIEDSLTEVGKGYLKGNVAAMESIFSSNSRGVVVAADNQVYIVEYTL